LGSTVNVAVPAAVVVTAGVSLAPVSEVTRVIVGSVVGGGVIGGMLELLEPPQSRSGTSNAAPRMIKPIPRNFIHRALSV